MGMTTLPEQLRLHAQMFNHDTPVHRTMVNAAKALDDHTPTWDAYHTLSAANEAKRVKIKALEDHVAQLLQKQISATPISWTADDIASLIAKGDELRAQVKELEARDIKRVTEINRLGDAFSTLTCNGNREHERRLKHVIDERDSLGRGFDAAAKKLQEIRAVIVR